MLPTIFGLQNLLLPTIPLQNQFSRRVGNVFMLPTIYCFGLQNILLPTIPLQNSSVGWVTSLCCLPH
ncbi:MAG: hypothetical protein DRR16_21655 [Candidatus Parabeggiatoa sp. nov. 3]|nr:MAG: hypothetical protein DRR00_02115 [Gammaproteobacteria bacterium]RKZ69449.1 MAG: hypothetical protein DRQ99_00930 [Gammaproteobacteria bacterium]RKZ81658.1 MAG: hypothetical protein DRR16_21655 [Gammaproteobacteria bacterium]